MRTKVIAAAVECGFLGLTAGRLQSVAVQFALPNPTAAEAPLEDLPGSALPVEGIRFPVPILRWAWKAVLWGCAAGFVGGWITINGLAMGGSWQTRGGLAAIGPIVLFWAGVAWWAWADSRHVPSALAALSAGAAFTFLAIGALADQLTVDLAGWQRSLFFAALALVPSLVFFAGRVVAFVMPNLRRTSAASS